jgi:ADP-heptose:LPS heptosyltransferase
VTPAWLRKVADSANYLVRRGKMLLSYYIDRPFYRLRLGPKPKRILILRLGSLGDVVRATSIVIALRKRYPQSSIELLTSEAAKPLVVCHSALSAVHTLRDLHTLGTYDWVINLQSPEPIPAFLDDSGLTYIQVLEHISGHLGARIVSGRRIHRGRERQPTDLFYCSSEMEQLFLVARLPFDRKRYPDTGINVDQRIRSAAEAKFPIPAERPVVAIFLGANSVGRGADEGYRTYSITYLEALISHFVSKHTVVVFGQSHLKTEEDLNRYRGILQRYPEVIDLVDRTSLDELVALMDRFSVVVGCDSSPIHLALARNVPVVGLYVNDASFRLGLVETDKFIAINSRPPCFAFSWRWKFFCLTCRDPATRASYCHVDGFTYVVDRIPVAAVDAAVTRLLAPGGGAPAWTD